MFILIQNEPLGIIESAGCVLAIRTSNQERMSIPMSLHPMLILPIILWLFVHSYSATTLPPPFVCCWNTSDEPEARTECERAFEGAIQVDPTNPQGYLTAANYYTVTNAEQVRPRLFVYPRERKTNCPKNLFCPSENITCECLCSSSIPLFQKS